MTFNAVVVRVLIASPSDTATARRTLREVLEDWNSLHAETDGVMLLPVIWERDATPEMGERPQSIINRQLVDAADVLIGIFWTRLGTPTSEADSGTVEEIDRFMRAGKPVLLYFSSEPVAPDIVDQEELGRLAKFRKEFQERGLIDRFSTNEELYRKATAAPTRTVRDRLALNVNPAVDSAMDLHTGPGAVLVARVEREREVRGFSKAGKPQYSTRTRLVIENNGTTAAESLTFRFEAPEAEGRELPSTFGNEEPVGKLPPGAALDYPLMLHMGTVPQWDIVFEWREGEHRYEDRQTLR